MIPNGTKPTDLARPARLDALRLLFVGAFDPLRKGIFDLPPIMARAARARPGIRLTVAGGRSAELERAFSRRGLASLVDFVGSKRREECFELYATHDVLVMPSRREAFGMVTLEAMAHGCVPVAYDVPSGSRLLIEPDVSANLAVHPDLLARLSDAAMRRAATEFSAMRMAAEYARLFCEIRENRTSPLRWPLDLAQIPLAQELQPKKSAAHAFKTRAIRWISRSPRLSYLAIPFRA
jgi:glycosyltransferase involved in cell wall biosynthesis